MAAVCMLVDPSWESFALDAARIFAVFITSCVIVSMWRLYKAQVREGRKLEIIPTPLILFTVGAAGSFLAATVVLLFSGCTTQIGTVFRVIYLSSSSWTMGGLVAIVMSGVRYHNRAIVTAERLPEDVKEELIRTVIDRELADASSVAGLGSENEVAEDEEGT